MTISPSGYTDDFGPNVANILASGTRVIRGRVPAQVRKELCAAVKAGVLGHLKKDGLKPEIFYHPDRANLAREIQSRHAMADIEAIAKVIVPPSEVRAELERRGIDLIDYVSGR